MPIHFLTRLAKREEYHLSFRVPKYVKEFYGLKPGSYRGGVTLADGLSASYLIKFHRDRESLIGKVPLTAGFPKSLVDIWVYRDTWTPLVRTPVRNVILKSRRIKGDFVSSCAVASVENLIVP